MKTYNEFRSKAFDWLEFACLKTALRYVMSWELDIDCDTEMSIAAYEQDRVIFSHCIRRFSKYKIT